MIEEGTPAVWCRLVREAMCQPECQWLVDEYCAQAATFLRAICNLVGIPITLRLAQEAPVLSNRFFLRAPFALQYRQPSPGCPDRAVLLLVDRNMSAQSALDGFQRIIDAICHALRVGLRHSGRAGRLPRVQRRIVHGTFSFAGTRCGELDYTSTHAGFHQQICGTQSPWWLVLQVRPIAKNAPLHYNVVHEDRSL